MATTKTFKVAGTTRLPSGTVKVRFANDLVSRIKILFKTSNKIPVKIKGVVKIAMD